MTIVIMSRLMEAWSLIFLAVLLLAIIGWLIFLTVERQKIVTKMGYLFSGNEKESLGDKIKGYAKDVKMVEDHVFKLDKEIKRVASISESGLYRRGFVRYNPFGDVGGNQSFSLCLLDKEGDGYVVSSIHSREGTRVYAKTVEGGKSAYNLSEEEKKSIQLALAGE